MTADNIQTQQLQSIIEFDVALVDVDPFFIHYTTYTNWMDRGLMAILRVMNHPLREILEEGYGFPMVQCHVDFFAPANLDDHLRLTTTVKRLGRTSITFEYDFKLIEPDGASILLVHAETVHVCTDRATKRPMQLPDWLRAMVGVSS